MVIPDCIYHHPPILVPPKEPTPREFLYLSNLDDQKFLRFTIKYLYLFQNCPPPGTLKDSLSAVLVHYYPLAGRLKVSEEDREKLQVDCNGEGALFSEAFVDMTVEDFLGSVGRPDKSWRKLLYYRGEGQSFLDAPLLSIQVTHLRCGGMILCSAVNHCIADGIGTVRFLRDWAQISVGHTFLLHSKPLHSRELLRPRTPLQTIHPHSYFSPGSQIPAPLLDPERPVVPTSTIFSASSIMCLKKLCVPSLKCTSFEVLAAHVWRTWVRSLALPHSLRVKLLFSVNIRSRMQPKLPDEYYGNAFVLACAESSVQELLDGSTLSHAVELLQEAKGRVTDEYVRSTVDYLEGSRAWPDLTAGLVISPWRRLGLEDLDFGQGKPVHMGPLSSEIHCLFLPVVNKPDDTTVLLSVPADVVDKFEHLLNDFSTEVNLEKDSEKSVADS